MEYPKLSRNPSERIHIPGFDGGVNHSEMNAAMGDNQLRDVLNMWWKDGALTTRPGIKSVIPSFYDTSGKTTVSVSGGSSDIPSPSGSKRRIARTYRRYTTTALYDVVVSTFGYDGTEEKSIIRTGMSAMECASVMLAECGGGQWSGTAAGGAVAFIGQGGKGWGGKILAQPTLPDWSWVDLTSQAYIPLVMINGAGSPTTETAQYKGTIYEGFNLLTPKFRARFTTNDEASRYFYLPVKQLDSTEIIVHYTASNGTVYTYTIPAGSSTSAIDENGLQVRVNRTGGYIYYYQPSMGAVRWFPSTGISNNLEVMASKTRAEGRDKICSMGFCTWFGGDRSGYNGGTRLFVSGHKLFPNLVHWSDVNNPLYFPENNFAFIGDAGQAVTAFAKQGEKLIIFKEYQMYYATYTAGNKAAQYLPDGTVVDATSNEARFPVVQLHPYIGCDCPGTIQLCDNRLVWANSSRKVYALAAANQYSQSNVREISSGVAKRLSAIIQADFKAALSGDCCGHYILMVGKEMLLFHYNDGNFASYIQGTAKSHLHSRIPWMYWKFDIGMQPDFIMANGDGLVFSGKFKDGDVEGYINAVMAEDDITAQDDKLIQEHGYILVQPHRIDYMVETKLFDFDRPERCKDILPLYLELKCGQDAAVSAVYRNETGEISGIIPLESVEAGGMIRLTPNVSRVRCFGIGLQGSGLIAIGSMTMQYRLYGKGIR